MALNDSVHDASEHSRASEDIDLEEKQSATHRETATGEDEEFSPREQKKIFHKIDRRLLIINGAMCAVSFLDRANMSNANIAGMSAALGFDVGTRYATVLLVFFAPYVLAQFPASIIVRKVGPRLFMSTCVTAWGIVVLSFGFVDNWWSLIPLRMVLGLLEAGLLPAQYYLISCWYPRYALHKRISAFYLVGVAGSAFGGVLALLFSQMDGLGNTAAWEWIFIMEGIITMLIGICGFIFMVDFPEKAHESRRFLTRAEQDFVIRTIKRDRDDTEVGKISYSAFFKAALDWKIWAFALLFFCSTTVVYSTGFYLPLILRGNMGFSTAAAQALSTPPYVVAMIVMFLEGALCDKLHLRAPCLLFNGLLATVGLAIMTWTSAAASQYVGAVFIATGISANIPAIMVYQANNIRGPWKRAFCSASLISFGGLGGIAGSLIFRSQDAPRYIPGITACLVANGVLLLTTAILSLYFYRCNKLASKGKMVIEGLADFRYTY